MRSLRFILGTAAAFVLGVAVNNIPLPSVNEQHPQVDAVVWSESMAWAVEPWRAEIARRVPDAVAVFCHGDDIEGVWHFIPDRRVSGPAFPSAMPFGIELNILSYEPMVPVPVEGAVLGLKARYPGRTLVLVTCNPSHRVLNVPGVVYALDSVWVVPDRTLNPRHTETPTAYGNIYEFVVNP